MQNNHTEMVTEDKATDRRSPILPRNPNKAMQQMMDTIDVLRKQMVAETQALKETNTQEFMRLQDDKITISQRYARSMEEMIERKEEMRQATPALIEKLKAMRADFATITQENITEIQKMSKGMKSLETRIMEAARKEAQKGNQFAYGATGKLKDGLTTNIGINEAV